MQPVPRLWLRAYGAHASVLHGRKGSPAHAAPSAEVAPEGGPVRWLPPFIWRRRESIMLSCMVFRRRESQTVLSGAVFLRPAAGPRGKRHTFGARDSIRARAGRRVVQSSIYIYIIIVVIYVLKRPQPGGGRASDRREPAPPPHRQRARGPRGEAAGPEGPPHRHTRGRS